MNDHDHRSASEAHGATSADRKFFVRAGGLALTVLLGYLVFRIVEPLWRPLVWAALIGAVLTPWNSKLSTRLGNKPRLAAALTTIMTVLFFVLPAAVIAGTVAAQSAQLLKRLNAFVPKTGDDNVFNLGDVPWLKRPIEWIGAHTDVTLDQMQAWLVEGAKRLLQGLMSSSGSLVLGAIGTIVSFALMLFVLFFVLRDGPRYATGLVAMLPIEPRRRARLWAHLREVTRAVFMGIGLTAVVQGILLGIGFWIAGLPSPLVFGVLGILLALIPFVGTTILWGPGALWLASQADYGHAAFLAIWGLIVISTVDNFLRPFLISGRTEVPTLAVFIGGIGGLASFGFVGLFLGPIVLGLLVALLRFESERRAAAALPAEISATTLPPAALPPAGSSALPSSESPRA